VVVSLLSLGVRTGDGVAYHPPGVGGDRSVQYLFGIGLHKVSLAR